MAQYHLHTKPIGRGKGLSAVGAICYRAGVKITNEYDGVTHDYSNRNAVEAAAYRSGTTLTDKQGETHDFSKKIGIIHSEIMLPKNAPQEFSVRAILWNTVEKSEKRCDARTAREVEISLPVEFTDEQNIEVTKEFARKNFVDKGVIVDYSIHDKGVGNPHAHIMLVTRYVDKDGLKGKNRELDKTAQLKVWRKSWADICNKHLEKYGFSARIDHRTLKEQGIDREPMRYMGINYKHKKKILVTEKEQGEVTKHEIPITNAEIRKIERQIKQFEIAKTDLLKTNKKIEDLRQIRLKAKAIEHGEIDRQILHLEQYAKMTTTEIERKTEQFDRVSVRTLREAPVREQQSRELPNRPDRTLPNREIPSRELPSREQGLDILHDR